VLIRGLGNIGPSRRAVSIPQSGDRLPLRCSESGVVEREITQVDHRRELTGAGPHPCLLHEEVTIVVLLAGGVNVVRRHDGGARAQFCLRFPQVGALYCPWFIPMGSSKCAQRTSTASNSRTTALNGPMASHHRRVSSSYFGEQAGNSSDHSRKRTHLLEAKRILDAIRTVSEQPPVAVLSAMLESTAASK